MEPMDLESFLWVVTTGDVDPLGAAKVWDSGGSRESGTRQRDNVMGPINESGEFCQVLKCCHYLIRQLVKALGPKSGLLCLEDFLRASAKT
jgi:hypothetical protein